MADHLRTPEEMAAYVEAMRDEANGDAACIAKVLGDVARPRGWQKWRTRRKGAARPAAECCTSPLSWALIGCSREIVRATLGQFRDQGLIRMDVLTMTIVNQQGVRKLIG